MLDLETPEQSTEFDFSMDDNTQILEEPPQMPSTPEQAAPPVATEESAGDGDFWDLAGSEAAEPATGPKIEIPKPEPVAPPETPVETFPPVVETPAVDLSSAGPVEGAPSEEFGLDISVDSSDQASVTDGATAQEFEISIEESGGAEPSFTPADSFEPPPELENPPAMEMPSTPEPQMPVTTMETPAPSSGAGDLQLSEAQIEAIVTRVFEKVIERIAWEVVPDLAETIIKEELARLTKEGT